MKKTIAIAFLGALTLASCKKDYNCQCTVTSSTPEFVYAGTVVQPASTTTASGTTTITDTKADAKTECESGNTTTTQASAYEAFGAGPTTTTTSCAIVD